RLLPFALPAFNRRNQPASIRIARRQTRSDLKLLQSTIVVLVDPVKTLTEREMSFCKIRLQPKRSLRFGAGFCFPALSGLVISEDLSTNRRQPRVSEREIRIEFDRLSVKLLGSLVILQQRIGIFGDLVRAQVKNVRVGVLC